MREHGRDLVCVGACSSGSAGARSRIVQLPGRLRRVNPRPCASASSQGYAHGRARYSARARLGDAEVVQERVALRQHPLPLQARLERAPACAGGRTRDGKIEAGAQHSLDMQSVRCSQDDRMCRHPAPLRAPRARRQPRTLQRVGRPGERGVAVARGRQRRGQRGRGRQPRAGAAPGGRDVAHGHVRVLALARPELLRAQLGRVGAARAQCACPPVGLLSVGLQHECRQSEEWWPIYSRCVNHHLNTITAASAGSYTTTAESCGDAEPQMQAQPAGSRMSRGRCSREGRPG